MIRKKINMNFAQEIATRFDIPHTRPHLLRVCRGWQIFAEGGVNEVGFDGYLRHYDVTSQGRNWKKRAGIDCYTVYHNDNGLGSRKK